MRLRTCLFSGFLTLSIAGAIALGMLAGGASAGSVGELSRGMLAERGWYAIAVPPIRIIDGRRVCEARSWNPTIAASSATAPKDSGSRRGSRSIRPRTS